MSDFRHYRPISQVEIEEKIQAGMAAMEEATEEFRAIVDDAADAEVEYKRSRSGAYLRAKGTIKDREYTADHLTIDEMRAYKRAEARSKAQREVLTTLRSNMDGLRSLNTNVRSQV